MYTFGFTFSFSKFIRDAVKEIALSNNFANVVYFGADKTGKKDSGKAINAAWRKLVHGGGGTLIMPAGTYLCKTQVDFDIRNDAIINLYAYGAEIKTAGPISGLKMTGPSWSIAPRHVYGLRINHRGNKNALYGFNLEQCWNVRLNDCTVTAHGVNQDYAAFRIANKDGMNNSTGSFWNVIRDCWVRKLSGDDPGLIPTGILLEGVSNASRIAGGGLNNVGTGILIRNMNNQRGLTDSVRIDGMSFEGYETAIHVTSSDSQSAVRGPFVVGNRAENGGTFFSLTDITRESLIPPYLAGNLIFGPLKKYINNPNGLKINSYDEGYMIEK